MDNLPAYLSGFLCILLLTAFAKLFTTLSILQVGIGLKGAGFGLIVAGVALALSLLVAGRQLQPLGGTEALFAGRIGWQDAAVDKAFRPFLVEHANAETVQKISRLTQQLEHREPPAASADAAPADAAAANAAAPEVPAASQPLPVLISAFLLTELRQAFQLGFIILLPFVVIDLLVVNVMLALGVTQISHAVVALPLKLLLFFTLDGWTLVTEKLLGTYL
jgi:flagellar biosynthesis protein FliP